MNVLLIKPNQFLGEIGKITHQSHPLGLCYIASSLEEKGHNVFILDLCVGGGYGEIYNIIKTEGISLIGIGSMTPSIVEAMRIAKFIKKHFNIFIVMGGNHPSALPQETLKECSDFDMVIQGEAEKTMIEICDKLNQKDVENILGTVLIRKNKFIINEPRPPIKDLDSLPFPSRHLLKLDKYKFGTTVGIPSRYSTKSTHLVTSRGCPYKCTFCATQLSMGSSLRVRTIKNVIEEIKECIYKYDMEYFRIHDSTFTIDREKTIKFCEEIKKLDVIWSVDTRVDKVDKELLQIMYDSGCKKVAYGVESGSPRILKLMKKGITAEQVKKAFKWSHEVGLITSAFFLIGGHPTETKEDINMTFKLSKDIKTPFPIFSIVAPLPCTELHKYYHDKGYILNKNWENYQGHNTIPVIRTKYFYPKDLIKIQNNLIKRHYFSIAFLLSRLKSIRSFDDISYYFKAGLHTLRYISR